MPTAETISEISRVSSRCVCASCTHLRRVFVRACVRATEPAGCHSQPVCLWTRNHPASTRLRHGSQQESLLSLLPFSTVYLLCVPSLHTMTPAHIFNLPAYHRVFAHTTIHSIQSRPAPALSPPPLVNHSLQRSTDTEEWRVPVPPRVSCGMHWLHVATVWHTRLK
jgi:hypothetical protein